MSAALHSWPLGRIRRAILLGETTARAVVDSALSDIAARNPKLGAFVALDSERARADADHLDALVKIRRDPGPLAGLTIGIKDLIDVEGLPTRAGTLTRRDAPPAASDASIVKNLRAAGALILGKTQTVEFAFGGWGVNPTAGTPWNPRDLNVHRAPGGSSSGSGAAVAAGLCAAAIGSDTGGSVRLPAAFCGTVGLKTTAGLIPKDRVVPLSTLLDTLGPLTNRVADAAAILAATAPSRGARWDAALEALARPSEVRGMRVGLLVTPEIAVHAAVAAALEYAKAGLRRAGVIVEEVSLPCPLAELSAPCGDLLAVEAYRHHGAAAEDAAANVGKAVRARILQGKNVSAARLTAIYEHREARKAEYAEAFGRYDAILTPVTPMPAPPIDAIDESLTPAVFTRFVNYLDLCAVALPMGATAEGLPVAVQFIAAGFAEPTALRLAAALEGGAQL